MTDKSKQIILAIDDNPDNLMSLDGVVEDYLEDCELITALTGKEGIALAIERQPDTILLDIIMPEIDGFTVCRKLKHDPKTASIPVILLTAMKADTENVIRGLEIGADAFFSKPIDPPELAAQIRVALRIKKSEDTLRQHKEELEGLVYERTKKLLSVNKELERENIVRRKAEEMLRESEENLRELSLHQEQIREKERINLARELHDELGQLITALKIDLVMVKERLPADSIYLRGKIKNLLGLTERIFESIRDISSQLRSELLENLGLVPAVENIANDFQERSGIKCRFDVPQDVGRCISDRETSLYRIVQESLTNVARHSEATEVVITFGCNEKVFRLTIQDNGIGIPPEKIRDRHSFGLLGMKERTLSMGGEISIKGDRGKGTTIRVEIPLEHESVARN